MHGSRLVPALSVAALVFSCARHERSEAPLGATGATTRASSVPTVTTRPEPAVITTLAEALPDHAAGFAASPLISDPQFVRRVYTRGSARISVTIAKPGATPVTYDDWVRMSADSPQVRLPIAPGSGAGFYDCAGKGLQGPCNVHIQLRAGHHIEMMGEHQAHRVDFDDLLAALPLRGLTQ